MSENSHIAHIDLFEDYADLLRSELRNSGFAGIAPNPTSVCKQFENFHRRRVAIQPRQVCRAQTLHLTEDSDFSQEELETKADEITEKAEQGEDLNPYLSRKLKDLSFNDGLLNDWGIHHFHLGEKVESDGFVERTGPLLYARVTDSHFYVIGIYDHDSFSDRDLIQVEYDNWPEAIEKYRLPDEIEPLYSYDDDQIGGLRDVGIQVFVELEDGTTYIHPGGGFTAAGEGANDVIVANNVEKIFNSLERSINEDVQGLVKVARERGFDINPPVNLHLKVDGTRAFAVDEDSDVALPLIDMERFEAFSAFLQSSQAT